MSPHTQVIARTRFSETLTSDLVLEVTQIQIHLRFLVDTLMLSISTQTAPDSQVIALTNLDNHVAHLPNRVTTIPINISVLQLR